MGHSYSQASGYTLQAIQYYAGNGDRYSNRLNPSKLLPFGGFWEESRKDQSDRGLRGEVLAYTNTDKNMCIIKGRFHIDGTGVIKRFPGISARDYPRILRLAWVLCAQERNIHHANYIYRNVYAEMDREPTEADIYPQQTKETK